MKHLRKVFAGLFFLLLLVIVVLPSSVFANHGNPVPEPGTTITCSVDGTLTIKIYHIVEDTNFNHYKVSMYHYSDGTMFGGNDKKSVTDIDIDNYTKDIIVKNIHPGFVYWTAVWAVDNDGQMSNNQSSYGYHIDTNCPVASPTGFRSSYSYPYMTIFWKPVQGAVKYAVRVNNTANPWNGKPWDTNPYFLTYEEDLIAMNDGDHYLNNVTDTQFKFKVAPGRKIEWWVYAIGANGFASKNGISKVTSYAEVGKPVAVTTPDPIPTPTEQPIPTPIKVSITPTKIPTPTPSPTVIPSPAPVYEQPKVNVSCDTGTFSLDLPKNPSSNWDHWAVRVDDGRNPWAGVDSVNPGDKLVDNLKDSTYQQSISRGVTYYWWTHSIDKNGVYNYTKGDYSGDFRGDFHCKLPAPKNLISACTTDPMTFSWSPVEGAAKYAVRVDDLSNGWNGDVPNTFDRVLNDVTNTSITKDKVEGHNYNWWVHAVDSAGVYSDPAWATCI